MLARLTGLLPALALVAATAASAAPPPKVLDEGKLFSERAIKEANEIIADIERKFKKDVRVEAYSVPPAAKAAEFQQHKREPGFRTRFFTTWEADRMRATGNNGVFVLVYQDKAIYFVEIDVGPNHAPPAIRTR